MKRTILSLLLLATAVCGALAQNDAMYIYRNDGEFNAFLKADIDSIVQSHYDADSVLHADWQMQVVYTADSIYKIPLVAIDSISFVTPEPILNEKVFLLTAAHEPFLSDCDTIRFTLSLDTPPEMRPSKGNIVVSTYDCLSFPDGIMARILSKTQDGSGIHYNCEKVGLEDVYEQLVFIGECYVEDPQASSRRKAEVTYEREIWNKSWSKTLEKGGTTTTLEIGDAARMKVTVNIQLGKPMYFRLDLQNDLTSSIKFNATSSFEKYYEKELVKKVTLGRIPIPGTVLWVTPKLGLSGYFAEGATVSLDCNAHFNRTDKVSFTLQNKHWSVHHAPVNNAGVDVASLSMTGYMEVGLIPDLLFSLCGSSTGLGLEFTVGVKESVDFKFDAVAAFDEGMYSALKDSYARTTIPWSARAYVQLGLFGDGIQPASVKVSGEPQIGTDKYLLPLFTEPEFQQGANAKTAVLKTEPSRDLLLPVQLGMSFYEGDEKLETKYLSTTYRNQSEWPLNGVQVAYTNMEAGKTYTAYPTVKIMGKELRAVPSTDFPELPPLQFKELIWDNYYYYANDKVYGTLLAVVEVPPGQEVDLSAYESCGIWMTNNITGMEYYSDLQENGSMQFYIPLEIPRDEFEKDYDSFTATCDKILLSTYAVDKDGNITWNDERVADIVYDVPPSFTYTKASITGIQVIERDEDNRPKRYRTDYSYGMDIIGAFWISAVQYRFYSTVTYGWNGSTNWATVPMDASYSGNSAIEYDKDRNISHTEYTRMQLTDGSMLNSTNSLVFGGTPSNPTVYIGGEPSQAPAINVGRGEVKEVFTSPFEIVKENAIIRNRITNKAIEGR